MVRRLKVCKGERGKDSWKSLPRSSLGQMAEDHQPREAKGVIQQWSFQELQPSNLQLSLTFPEPGTLYSPVEGRAAAPLMTEAEFLLYLRSGEKVLKLLHFI